MKEVMMQWGPVALMSIGAASVAIILRKLKDWFAKRKEQK